MRVLRATGRSFDDGGIIHKMLSAPIALAYPDLTLPAVHDCWYFIALTGEVGHGIPDAAGFYEKALGASSDNGPTSAITRLTMPRAGLPVIRLVTAVESDCTLARPSR